MEVRYINKNYLYPAFGKALMKEQIALVRQDLPEIVQSFVKEHELYHLGDSAKWWLWREIKANSYGAWKHPIGFLYCCVLSLSCDRLKFYYNRFKKGK